MSEMFNQTIRALAAIDTALGMPDDGCNSTERTITAIKLLHSAHKDDVAAIKRLRAENAKLRAGIKIAATWTAEPGTTVAQIRAAFEGATVQPTLSTPPDGQASGEGAARAKVVPSPYGSGAQDQSAGAWALRAISGLPIQTGEMVRLTWDFKTTADGGICYDTGPIIQIVTDQYRAADPTTVK